MRSISILGLLASAWLACSGGPARAGLATGDEVEVMLKGVPVGEQEQVNGKFEGNRG